jgi:Tfp pilus assembly protein PilN
MINLLAWHKQTYQQKRRQFLNILGACVVFPIIIVISWDVLLWHKVKLKNNENIIIEQRLTNINNQIAEFKKNDDDNLQYLQFGTAMMLQELSTLVPQNVYLSEINKDELAITLEGSFISYEDINKFIINITKSDWLKNPILSKVTNSHFKIYVTLIDLKKAITCQ